MKVMVLSHAVRCPFTQRVDPSAPRDLLDLLHPQGLNLRENGLAEEKFENRPRGVRKNRNPYLYRAGATKRP